MTVGRPVAANEPNPRSAPTFTHWSLTHHCLAARLLLVAAVVAVVVVVVAGVVVVVVAVVVVVVVTIFMVLVTTIRLVLLVVRARCQEPLMEEQLCWNESQTRRKSERSLCNGRVQ